MSTFDENKHRRGQPGNDGQFAKKENRPPSEGLSGFDAIAPIAPAAFDVEILDAPDPVGGFDTVVEAPTGTRYLREGKLHRVGAPAYEGRDGSQAFYRDGELDRDPQEGPALVEDGYSEFYRDGRLVRV